MKNISIHRRFRRELIQDVFLAIVMVAVVIWVITMFWGRINRMAGPDDHAYRVCRAHADARWPQDQGVADWGTVDDAKIVEVRYAEEYLVKVQQPRHGFICRAKLNSNWTVKEFIFTNKVMP